MRLKHHKIKTVEDLRPYLNDDRLDFAIGSMIGSFDDAAIQEWKSSHVSDLKRVSYPPITELADAMAKLYSKDVELQTEGQNQMTAYSAKCMAVKHKFRKVANETTD